MTKGTWERCAHIIYDVPDLVAQIFKGLSCTPILSSGHAEGAGWSRTPLRVFTRARLQLGLILISDPRIASYTTPLNSGDAANVNAKGMFAL